MPTENEEAIRHLSTLTEFFKLAAHNERIDALCWLINDRARLGAELERLKQSIAGTCHREVVGCDANEHAADYANEQLSVARALLTRVITDEMTPESGVRLLMDIGTYLESQVPK